MYIYIYIYIYVQVHINVWPILLLRDVFLNKIHSTDLAIFLKTNISLYIKIPTIKILATIAN